MESKIELKRCPFCGERPVVYRSSFSERYRIRCERGCGAETAPYGNKEKAIKKWNMRADESL